MTVTEEIIQVALVAPIERKRNALRLLKGEAELAGIGEERPAIQGPLLMGIGAGAKFLGVSRATLWRACVAGRLAKVELFPGSYRVRRDDLVALAEGRGGKAETGEGLRDES